MIAVYCDGSYHADTGKAGIAVILYHNQAPVYLLTDEVVAANPTDAEMAALERGKSVVELLYPEESYELYTDCNNVVAKSQKKLQSIIRWIPREKNMVAEALACCAHNFSVEYNADALNLLLKEKK